MHEAAEQPTRLSIAQTTTRGMRVLVLSGEVDADNVDALRQALQIHDGESRTSVLDLGGVTFIDSSAINVLVAAHREATSAGGWIRLAALTAPVKRVVELVGIDTVIGCYPTLAQALAASV
ncbi:STAS domain-containing protein [Streptomyces sp. NPDC048643]|uniref:STAS domain-containing protein n=1 Tax=Streptomyces sp. NPDC048643 TaxID=3155637 RepID=UPI003417D514